MTLTRVVCRAAPAVLAILATPAPTTGQGCSGVTIPQSAAVAGAPFQPGTGLKGEYWDQSANSNATAEAIINAGNPDAEFLASHLDYPNGPTDVLGSGSTIGQLLGVDSFTGVHSSDPVPGFVFHFHGYLRIDTVGGVTFALGSDDGTCLRIGGITVVDNPGIHGFGVQTGTACFQASGLYPVDIIFYNEPAHGGIEWDSSLTGGPNSGAPAGTVGIVPVAHLYDSIPLVGMPPITPIAAVSASYALHGSQCPGPAGIPTLAVQSLPRVGGTVSLDITNLTPVAMPFMLMGFSNSQWAGGRLPYPITQFGPPFCDLLVSPDAGLMLANNMGSATWSLNVPNDPMLSGLEFCNQCIAIAVLGGNVGLSASERGDGTIGIL